MTSLLDLVCKFTNTLLGFCIPLSAAYNIGDYAEGGVIFWLTSDRQHGLVCAISDITMGDRSTFSWSLYGAYDTIGAKVNGLSIGWESGLTTPGLINTQLIVAKYGSGLYAAKVCSDYSVTVNAKTYDDWYLPSLAELRMMYANKAVINTTASSNGGSAFENAVYWSSLEYNTGNAYAFNFSNAYGGASYNKIVNRRVRAVRAF